MARLVLRFALYLFLGLLACSSFGQDATFDFHNVMKDISARCEAPKEYAFEAELQLAGQRGAEPGRILAQAKIKLAVAQRASICYRLSRSTRMSTGWCRTDKRAGPMCRS